MMKKWFVGLVAMFVSSGMSSHAQAVYSPNTAFCEPDPVVLNEQEPPVPLSGGIMCNPNTFWANTGGTMTEYAISGSQITATGISYSIPFNRKSAIYANHPSGTPGFSPTFYSMDTDTLSRYDGASWPVEFIHPGLNAFNGGGSGDHIYFGGFVGSNPVPSTRVYHYSTATGIDTVYITPPPACISVADYVADANGNVYFLTGSTSNSDTLVVVSPAGTVLNRYPLALNIVNAYGAFMIGNVYYVGLGSFNPVNPLSLIPVTVTPTSATAGTPIAFPMSSGYYDLESCNQGLPLGLLEQEGTPGAMTVAPNPASLFSEVILPPGLLKGHCEMTVTSSDGKLVHCVPFSPDRHRVRIGLEQVPPGIYFVRVRDAKNVFSSKLLVY